MSETYFEVAEDVVFRTNKDGTVVIMRMDDSNNFYKIDGVAAKIWTELSGNLSLEMIQNNILNEYEVSSEKIATDSEHLIASLLQKNLIKKK